MEDNNNQNPQNTNQDPNAEPAAAESVTTPAKSRNRNKVIAGLALAATPLVAAASLFFPKGNSGVEAPRVAGIEQSAKAPAEEEPATTEVIDEVPEEVAPISEASDTTSPPAPAEAAPTTTSSTDEVQLVDGNVMHTRDEDGTTHRSDEEWNTTPTTPDSGEVQVVPGNEQHTQNPDEVQLVDGNVMHTRDEDGTTHRSDEEWNNPPEAQNQ